jgi:predicted peptidase
MSGMTRRELFASFAAAALPRRSFAARVFDSGGVTLPYRIASPAVRRRAKYPLVLWLHGGGGRGTDTRAQLAEGNSRGAHVWLRAACYVVAPQCPKGVMWSTIDTVDPRPHLLAAAELVDELQRTLPIDPSRVSVAGQSMGGFATWALLAHFPGRFAAGVPVCGGGNPSRAAAIARTSVWAFHGALDEAVPVERSRVMVEAVRRAGGTVRYTEYPDVAHDSWTPTFADPRLVPWVLAQRKERG